MAKATKVAERATKAARVLKNAIVVAQPHTCRQIAQSSSSFAEPVGNKDIYPTNALANREERTTRSRATGRAKPKDQSKTRRSKAKAKEKEQKPRRML